MTLATTATAAFDHAELLATLERLDDAELDRLDFGVIGFDAEGLVCRYNSTESRLAGLSADNVLGLQLFGVVSQCMNNYLVAQRFEDCADSQEPLDATFDYVFTLRMKPTRVKLRLLYHPAHPTRYVCVLR